MVPIGTMVWTYSSWQSTATILVVHHLWDWRRSPLGACNRALHTHGGGAVGGASPRQPTREAPHLQQCRQLRPTVTEHSAVRQRPPEGQARPRQPPEAVEEDDGAEEESESTTLRCLSPHRHPQVIVPALGLLLLLLLLAMQACLRAAIAASGVPGVRAAQTRSLLHQPLARLSAGCWAAGCALARAARAAVVVMRRRTTVGPALLAPKGLHWSVPHLCLQISRLHQVKLAW
jgi:hypothetical protein